MYRSDQPMPDKLHINIALTKGGLGDAIASLPVMKYILDHYRVNQSFHFWVASYFKEVATFCFPDADIFGLDEKDKWKDGPTITTMIEVPTYLRQHLTDYASSIAIDGILKPTEKNYTKPDISKHKYSKGIKDYISVLRNKRYVIFTTMFTSDTRAFRAKEINKITQWCSKNDLYPVFCGKEKTEYFKASNSTIEGKSEKEVDYSIGLNLINKTSLLDFIKLANDAHSVIGLDNGLLHLACMTDAHVIGGYTTVLPEHRLPFRYDIQGWNYDVVVPDEKLECRFCQSNWTYEINQNFTKCFYNDYKCCDQITAEKFIKILEGTI